jgi:hypothetical protein
MRRHEAHLCCTRLCRLSSHTEMGLLTDAVWRQASRTIFSPIQHSFLPPELVHGCCSALQRVSTATGPYGSSGTVAVRAQVDMALETAGQQLWCETGCTLWRGNLHTTNQRVAATLRTHAAHALKRPLGGIQAGRRVVR